MVLGRRRAPEKAQAPEGLDRGSTYCAPQVRHRIRVISSRGIRTRVISSRVIGTAYVFLNFR